MNTAQGTTVQTLTLPNGAVIMLNQEQLLALKKIKQWLSQDKDMLFVLSGYAGTGKTTIVKHVMDEEYRLEKVVTAPTHKAKKLVINSTGIEGTTIQGLLGLQPNVDLDDFDINNPIFAVRKRPEIEDYGLVVIDEASMLNQELFKHILKEAEVHKTKVLFMCDEAQLPPVKEEISLVVTSAEVRWRAQLTQVERQSYDNPIMGIYDSLRNNLSSRVDVLPIHDVYNAETEEGFLRLPFQKFGQEAITAFCSSDFRADANYARVLCWTNDRVKFWNQAIRKSIMIQADNRFSGVLREGELLMAYNSYQGSITNSADYVVTNIEYLAKEVKYGERNSLQVIVRGYSVVLTDVDTNNVHKTFIVEHEETNLRAFMEAFDYYLDNAKFNRKWREYYAFKAKFLLLQDIYRNGRREVKKDLDYAYALTVHKSQGSTYGVAFIDMPDINRNSKHEERNKLKYVALSRISQTAYVLAA